MNSEKMTGEEWSFFQNVARAAFANPFGEKRHDLDIVIGGASPGARSDEVIDLVVTRVAQGIEGLRRKGGADLRRLEGERRGVLRNVFLFHLFHRHLASFDALIQSQLRSGAAPVRVPFSRDVLNEACCGFGFSEEEALRFFAMFYQLRRAFYFISNGLVGSSPSMRTLRKDLWECVFTHDVRWFEARLWDRMEDFSILLLGETGTGKGAAAAAIGRSGFIPYHTAKNSFAESFTSNFVAGNLSQFSEGVLESELFGHKKGAFTGAIETREGLFGRCAPHGVIFLDEIGDIAIPLQIKLLHVLQERAYYPVGSHEAKRFSGRVVAATNRPLDDLISAGRFRDDLFYRLCSNIVTIPPLRQRLQEEPAELDNLVGSILARVAGETSEREKQLVCAVLRRDLKTDYPWPGNVRELEQAVKRVILTGHCQGVKRKEGSDQALRLAGRIKDGTLNAEGLLAAYCSMLYQQSGTYEEVSRRTELDRRTVKKYVQLAGDDQA